MNELMVIVPLVILVVAGGVAAPLVIIAKLSRERAAERVEVKRREEQKAAERFARVGITSADMAKYLGSQFKGR